MSCRQGDRLYVRVPRTRATVAAGLTQLNGLQVLLVRRASFDDAQCWVTEPPLRTTLMAGAQDEQGRELLPGHQVLLPGLPEAWMTARAPSWSDAELTYLREHYGTQSTAAIADYLGRGLAAVRSKIEDLHLRCRTAWTPELDELVTELYPDNAAPALAELLGVTDGALRVRAAKLGVKKAQGFAAEHARITTLARSNFTPEICEIVELLYPDTLTESIAQLVGMPKDRIHAFAHGQGWKKTKQFVRDIARARSGPDHPMRRSQFQKGLVPWNKGRKGITYPGMRATQFKKGQVPHTWKPIGSYRVNGDGYLDRKVTDTGYPPKDWVAVHRLVWIEKNGPVPEGHVVRFKDGMRTTDPEKITAEVLECITLAENARRNSFRTLYPPEIIKLIQTRAHMQRMINRRERQRSETHE